MKIAIALLTLSLAALLPRPMSAEDPPRCVASARPSVVSTMPQSGDLAVSPDLSEIRVTFSKQMKDKTWSWCRADEGDFPEMTGPPRYLEDGRTCVLPVKLIAGTTYALWINTGKFVNFQDRDGRPSVPYLLVFQTE